MGPHPLHQTLAAQLGKDLDRDPALANSTTSELAARYDVARLTMLRALRILRDRGVVEFRRGRRIRLANTTAPSPPVRAEPALSPQGRVVAAIEQEIARGSWRPGTPLPKMLELTSRLSASRTTVVGALREMARNQTVHKRGKLWHAGRAPNQMLVRGAMFPPVILLLADHEDRWTGMFSNRQVNRFAEAFSTEAEERGVQLLPVLTEPRGPGSVLVSGREAIAEVVRGLGKRFLGSLMLPLRMPQGATREWLEFMASLGKPALRLTPPGSGYTHIDNPSIVWCMFGSWGSLKYGGAVAVAWDMLDSLGHRSVGMPSVIPEFAGLVDIMVGLFLRDARARPDRIVALTGADTFWDRGREETRDQTVVRLMSKGVPFVRRLLRSRFRAAERTGLFGRLTDMERNLVADTALVAPLIAEHRVTALIGANDFLARRIYLWCRAAGVRVPSDISLISFDNSVEIKPYPISSMDLGQRRLGFKSFHLLYGDIPVTTTPAHQLWGGTSLNHAASLGPPSGRDLSTVVRGEWR